MDAAIEATDLQKVFLRRRKLEAGERRRWFRRMPEEPVVAVAGVDLQVRSGELFGLLGPNGAGKTTTIRMLCTLLEPSGGRATVWGHDVVREAALVRQQIGAVLMGERSVYWKLTGRENLEYFAALYHIPPRPARERIGALLEQVQLADRADDFVERYSSGMRQRLAIAKGLLNDPPVLFLDEPTVGLDPQSARAIRELIHALNGAGKTIILTTHYMEEADQLADRIGIIDHGRIIALGTPGQLKRQLRDTDVLLLEVEGDQGAVEATLRRMPLVAAVSGRWQSDESGLEVSVQTRSAREALPQVIEAVTRAGGTVRNLRVQEPSLEDVFIALTGRALRE